MKILNLLFSFLVLFIVIDLFDSQASFQMDLSVVGIKGVVIALKATALSNFFALLSSASMVVISFFAFTYELRARFFILLELLGASLLLIVYAQDYLLFFIGWEIMSWSTYLLLSNTLDSRSLHKYILFAMASALTLLAAIMILYSGAKSFLYADLHVSYQALSQQMRYLFIICMLSGIFINTGTIGFHYWLVDTYEKSADIFSAFLSAVLSKMGIYALIIFVVYLGRVEINYGYVLAIMGVVSSIIATFKAMNEDSIKRVLAYSSISQLGYIVTVLALPDALGGALYHAVIHTAVKLLLFINVAGVIYVTSRHKFSELGALIHKMPYSFVFMLIGIIVLAGMPPLGGFNSKFLIYSSLLQTNHLLILSAMMFASASAFLYIYKLIYGIYLGQPTCKDSLHVKEVSLRFLLPQFALSLLLIILGAFPALLVPYFNQILNQLHKTPMEFSTISTLYSEIGSYNGLIVISAFVAVFVLVALFLIKVKSKIKRAKNRFDIAYCGEVPDHNTPLHYGFSMAKELKRVGFISSILKNSSSFFYEYLATSIHAFSDILRRIYSGNMSINFNVAILFALILLLWGLK
jgi:NADH-quinone oxidoreductase subunit M